MSLTAIIDMAEASMEHPTAGRRRRHKSPPVLRAQLAIPVPRLEDQIDTENGPSDEDGEKDAKRQRSEPTTPISTSSRLPFEYDRLMGITQVGSGEAEGFEEGNDLVYHDAAEDPNVLESAHWYSCKRIRHRMGTGVERLTEIDAANPKFITCSFVRFFLSLLDLQFQSGGAQRLIG